MTAAGKGSASTFVPLRPRAGGGRRLRPWPWAWVRREKDPEPGVMVKTGRACVQWFTVEEARVFADQLHDAADAAELGEAGNLGKSG